MLVPAKDQELILSTIDELPPKSILVGLNPEQTDHWQNIRDEYNFLHRSLKAYFSGKSFPLKDELTDFGQELFGCFTDYHIKLYAVVQWGWDYILDFYSKHGNKDELGENFPYASPGELLAEILRYGCLAKFDQCLMGRHDFKPRKMYELRLDEKKDAKGKLSKAQKTKHLSDANTLDKPFEPYMRLEKFCMIACYDAAKKDKTLKKRLIEYEKSGDDLKDITCKKFRGMKGYAWEKGKILKTSKAGGTYNQIS